MFEPFFISLFFFFSLSMIQVIYFILCSSPSHISIVFWYFLSIICSNDTLYLFYGLFSPLFLTFSFSIKSFRLFCSKLLTFLGFFDRSFWWSFVLSFIFLTDVVYWFVFSFSHFCCVLIFFVYYLFEWYSLTVLWFVFSTIFYILRFLFKVSVFSIQSF